MSRISPTWAIAYRASVCEIASLDIPHMLDKLAEMQDFIEETRAKLESMQGRRSDLEGYLADLEEQT